MLLSLKQILSKWLLINAYKPPSVNTSLFCDQISRLLDFNSLTYKHIVLLSDFNMRITDSNFQAFYKSHDLYNLIKEKTCFKSIGGTCIDLILTKQKYSFKNSFPIDTGVSDCYGIALTQFKITFQKLPLRTISYRVFTNFFFIRVSLWGSGGAASLLDFVFGVPLGYG